MPRAAAASRIRSGKSASMRTAPGIVREGPPKRGRLTESSTDTPNWSTFRLFWRMFWSRLTLGDPEAITGRSPRKMMFGATYAEIRWPGRGITRRKWAPAAQMLTPSAKSPLLHG